MLKVDSFPFGKITLFRVTDWIEGLKDKNHKQMSFMLGGKGMCGREKGVKRGLPGSVDCKCRSRN